MNKHRAINSITLLLLFININIAQTQETASSNISLYYIILPIAIAITPIPKSLISRKINLLFITLLITNTIAYLRFGFKFEASRLAIMYLSFLFGHSLSTYRTEKEIGRYFNFTASIIITLIILRWGIYAPQTLAAIKGDRSALEGYPYLTTGGHNIEVTQFLFLSLLCSNKRISATLYILTLTLSIIYTSRIGVILCFFAISLYLYRRMSLKNFIISIAFLLAITSTALATISPKTFNRFTAVDKELEYGSEGVGRIGFYAGAEAAIPQNPYGFGIGNSIPEMSKITGVFYRENNAHNIYLQVALDSGIAGIIAYLACAIWIIRKCINQNFRTSSMKLACIYLTTGAIQFVGYDAIGWFVIGLAYPHLTKESHHEKTKRNNYKLE